MDFKTISASHGEGFLYLRLLYSCVPGWICTVGKKLPKIPWKYPPTWHVLKVDSIELEHPLVLNQFILRLKYVFLYDDLQRYQGDISELELYFVIFNDEYGKQTEEELLPGGKNLRVTNENVITFIHLVANHRLNFQVLEAFQFVVYFFLIHGVVPFHSTSKMQSTRKKTGAPNYGHLFKLCQNLDVSSC